METFHGKFTDAAAALRYMTAGHARVTLRSQRTGTRYTYRLAFAKDRATGKPDPSTIFVSVLNGPDNTADYKWFANLKGSRLFIGRKNPKPGDLTSETPSVKAFNWAWSRLIADMIPEQLDVWHEGSCGRCGRDLTVPESVESGFGPECRSKIGF